MTFTAFPKIARLSREMIVTEKLDGTNAAVGIARTKPEGTTCWDVDLPDGPAFMWAQSRTQVIVPPAISGNKNSDNYGFAAWAHANRADLVGLGEGIHYGEWWGLGIQRNYGLREKRFSLFNVQRWVDKVAPPACCHVVPVLYRGDFDTAAIVSTLAHLRETGSVAAPGYANPEGVIVFHTASRTLLKKTFEKDDAGKEYGA